MSKKWKQVTYKDSGKFYTGYDGYDLWDSEEEPNKQFDFSSDHDAQHLSLKLGGMIRGRSAANFYLVDGEGHKYLTSMTGIHALLDACIKSQVSSDDGEYIDADFKQTKQGANYFIEVVV